MPKAYRNRFPAESKFKEIRERLENEPVFDFLKEIKKEFPAGEIFLVGGAVRDLILERPNKDYDFVIGKIDGEKLKEFLAKIGVVNWVGQIFSVFKFIPHRHYDKFKAEKWEQFDLALPRTEKSGGSGAYRDFNVQSDPNLPLEKDLERRDFTVNAFALRITNQREFTNLIVDPFSGLDDLENKIIRAVGEPEERFKEDYSRILRALRFACQLGFEIEKKTFAAVKKNAGALTEKNKNGEWLVPRETVAKEILKTFYADPVRAFDLCDAGGVFEVLAPEILKMKHCPQPAQFHSEGDVWTHARLTLAKLFSPEFKKKFGAEKPTAQLIIALLLHDIGKPPTLKTPEKDGTDRIRFDEHAEIGAEMAEKIIKRLGLETMDRESPYHISAEKVGWLIKNHLLLLHGDPKAMRPATIEKYFFNPLSPGDELIKLTWCDAQATIPPAGHSNMEVYEKMIKRIEEVGKLAAERHRLPPPLLNGDEIMKILRINPGPKVGEAILKLREEQLEGKIKDKKEAEKFLLSLTKNR